MGALAQSDVIVEETSPALVYEPSFQFWGQIGVAAGQPANNYYHGGGYVSTDSPGASVSLTFNGSYVAFYSDGYIAHGMMEVDMDGRKSQVNQWSNNTEGQKMFFQAHVDPNTPNHVIKLTCLEKKTMGVDYFVYTAATPQTAGPDSSAPTTSFSKTGSDRGTTKEPPSSTPAPVSSPAPGDSTPGGHSDLAVSPTGMGTTSTITTAGATFSSITIIKSSKTTIVVAVGAVFGGLSLLCFLPLCVMLWCRHRRRARAMARRPTPLAPPTSERRSLVVDGSTAAPSSTDGHVQRDGKLRNLGMTQMSASGTRIISPDDPEEPLSRRTSMQAENGTFLTSTTRPPSSHGVHYFPEPPPSYYDGHPRG
ncbi:hypothetical protein AURDEDRAFT_112161 [Auricularia subglabra TFB-10046 SS5]|nr:hypothetical protein AURDEDRAFT_112161 [Auricularia subglabra TFB-10046 SS5]